MQLNDYGSGQTLIYGDINESGENQYSTLDSNITLTRTGKAKYRLSFHRIRLTVGMRIICIFIWILLLLNLQMWRCWKKIRQKTLGKVLIWMTAMWYPVIHLRCMLSNSYMAHPIIFAT